MSASIALHGKLISDFLWANPEFETRGFAKSMKAQFCCCEDIRRDGYDFDCEFCLGRGGWPMVPDLYLINPIDCEVVIVEAQVTNPIDSLKIRKIVNLWWTVDCAGDYFAEDWSLRLVVIDRCGVCRESDLALMSISACQKEWEPELLWRNDSRSMPSEVSVQTMAGTATRIFGQDTIEETRLLRAS